METASIIFISSIAVFTAFAGLVRAERKNARRLVGGRFRDSLDVHIFRIEQRWTNNWKHLSRYILQLGWYYSIHSLLSTVLRVLVSVYNRIEHIFERNRARTKELRKELKKHVQQSHLSQIAHHQEKTALSSEEKTQLRKDKLEQDH